MGQYRITIEGTGCHHNSKEARDRQPHPVVDADHEAKLLVTKLQQSGATLRRATFELVDHTFTKAHRTEDLLNQVPE